MTSLISENITGKERASRLIWGLLLVLVLLAAVYFRFRGIDWGEFQYLHPDERFLVWVGTDISPVDSISAYFDTATSSLNPHNRGHGFYVYGTLPMFLARYVVEWVFGQSGFDEMTRAGRPLSALADLGTVLLVYLAAKRLYDRRVGVLAAAFSAAAVLQIQQSHFFTMDTFLTFFSFLAFYCGVLVVKGNSHPPNPDPNTQIASDPVELVETEKLPSEHGVRKGLAAILRDPLFLPSLGFGIALGMAVASKLNAGAVAMVLPAAMILYVLKKPAERRESAAIRALIYLVMAAFVSLLVFRIFQPYAFSGPGILGIRPNPLWVENIRDQRAQSTGEVDFPPAMQWARRPIWFSLQNMVLWGLGLPLGILAWAGFLWAGWRLITQWNRRTPEWSSHALIWSWTALYFAWQSLQLNPTMRYQMPIYPNLAIFAAWAVFALVDLSRDRLSHSRSRIDWARIGGITLGLLVLLLTFAYAFAFTGLYERTITRIEASRWIYANLPGPVNLRIEGGNVVQNQILPVPYEFRILPQLPYSANFSPKTAGALTQIRLPHVTDESTEPQQRELLVKLNTIPPEGEPVATASVRASFNPGEPQDLTVYLDPAVQLDPEKTYNLTISLPTSEPVTQFEENALLAIEAFAGSGAETLQPVHLGLTDLRSSAPVVISFQAESNGVVSRLLLQSQPGNENTTPPNPTGVSLESEDLDGEGLYSPAELVDDPGSSTFQIKILEPLPVAAGESYLLNLSIEPRGGSIALAGTSLANEGDWDDGLPLRMDGYDGYGGIFPRDLNFNMYWDDNPEKLERFVRILNESDYLTISSNRQWGTLPRIPERFPMTTAYYRTLLGCPSNQDLVDCYRIAEPGMFTGQLGFELIKTFTSEPSLGPIQLNDQFAEEAFTVYDHPKVLVFKKTRDYNEEQVRQILGSVDFTRIIRKPPLKYSAHPEDLMLPEPRLQEQQQGGTWSVLFDPESPLNHSQPLAVLVWYLSVAMLGLIVFPILHLALPGLDDKGYPLARTAGMLLLSYLVWLAGSLRIPFTTTTISLVIALLALVGGILAYVQRKELLAILRSRPRYFLIVEGLALLFFLAFLLVRILNPDLWHPAKGGEKPMDFSYFNAVLKSTSFPPYDPWYAGGYLNYYYYGFMLVGVLVKWLGITPAVAYNLILPTLFSLIAMGAFSLAWNLVQKANASRADPELDSQQDRLTPYFPAVAAALGMAVLGNLGTVKMIFQGLQKLGAPGGVIDDANILTRLRWAASGLPELFHGMTLPYGVGDWYWNPSRIIPAMGDVEPITEFPYFTVLYADLHAHLVALPLALLALGFLFGIILGNARWKNLLGAGLWFFLAGLSIGVLRPTNTWDLPLYLALGVIAVIYSVWKNFPKGTHSSSPTWWSGLSFHARRIIASLGAGVLLALVAILLFEPYVSWYALGYTQINLWKGPHTPLSAYLNHWGLFLIVLVPWMVWETRDWLAKTPLSALHKLQPYRGTIIFLILVLFTLTIGLLFGLDISIAWFVLPLAAWAGVLILRPGQPDAKRIVLFLVGSGLALTLMVEVIVLVGDIGRMNTVFKFYLQIWTIMAVSAGAALGWLVPATDDWAPGWRWTWQIAFVLLVGAASLYTMQATMAKIDDRMVENGPVTLDGMAYMNSATYTDEWGQMDLGKDYGAIRWLQQNVQGSPVIVEANLRNLYRWGSRYTIYTGLPGVVGWEWHQQQQRAVVPGTWITERIFEIDDFYLTEDLEQAAEFLRKYAVQYIIVGQQERGHYPGPGLDKFEQADGSLWREVYRDGETVIYQVIGGNL